jgi:hypothetical protein
VGGRECIYVHVYNVKGGWLGGCMWVGGVKELVDEVGRCLCLCLCMYICRHRHQNKAARTTTTTTNEIDRGQNE